MISSLLKGNVRIEYISPGDIFFSIKIIRIEKMMEITVEITDSKPIT